MKLEINLWQVLSIVLAVALVVAVFRPWEKDIGKAGAEALAEKVITKYASMFGVSPTILKSEAKEVSGIYNVSVTLLLNNQTTKLSVYVTKDGKYWLMNVINVSQFLGYQAPEMEQQEMQEVEIPKSDTPEVDLYIMAFCPFGMKAIKTMIPVYKLLKDSVDFEVHYVIYENYGGENYCIENGSICSMHGLNELYEDMRQLCIAKEYGKETLWEYFDLFYNCGATDECREQAFEELGIDASKIEACMNSSWVIDKLYEEKQLNEQYGVRGSPTLFINGVQSNVVYDYGNSEAYKETICEAFNAAPAECNTTLSSESMGYGGTC